MRILVVGSEGFIGSAIIRYFSKTSEVYGADLAVESAVVKQSNYYCLTDRINGLAHVFQSTPFDLCINCAGSANVYASTLDPFFDFKANTNIVAEILSSLLLYSPSCKFINLSSAAVYGNPKSLPVKVGDDTSPISPYGIHKLAAELLTQQYARVLGLKTCSLRIFSSYGCGQKKLLLWDLFQKISNAPKGSGIKLYGTGKESRDYIHIDDIVRQIELVAIKGEFVGESYNVANGEDELSEEMANLIGTATESAIRLISEFRTDKLIEVDGRRMKILDHQKLVKLGHVN